MADAGRGGTGRSGEPEGSGAVRDLYAGWRYVAVGVLGAAAFALGLIGWYQTVPGIGLTDALYDTMRLFVFEYDLDGEPSVALDIARFAAGAVVYLAVAIAAVGILGRQFTLARASRLRGHLVVIGNGREATALAINHRAAGLVTRAVVIGEAAADRVLQRRGSGVLQLPSVSDAALVRILDRSSGAIVAAESDEEAVALTHRVRAAAPASSGATTTVMLTDRNLAGHWTATAPETVICRPAQLAVAVLSTAPPFPEDAMAPPPVVIGDGPVAAEITRRVVTGWQQPGERLRVYCVGTDRAWMEVAAAGIEERVELTWVDMPPNLGLAPRRVREIVQRWTPPDDRFAVGPARVYVAYPDTSHTVPIAAAIAHRVAEASVVAVVDDARTWRSMIVEDRAERAVEVISAAESLTDPSTLRLATPELLAAELIAEAGRWPADLPTAFGPIVRRSRGVAELADQSDAVRASIRGVATSIEDIFAAAGIELDVGFPADEPTLSLTPAELIGMDAQLQSVLPALGEDPLAARQRRIELAARLPVLAARAGLVPVRRGSHPGTGADMYPDRRPEVVEAAPTLTDAVVRRLALAVHADYQRTAVSTENATGSANAERAWAELSETDQRSSTAQVLDIPAKLAVLGLIWRPAAHPRPFTFTDAQVEQLAQMEHRRWVHFQLRNGRARHTFNVTWDELSDGAQEYDRGPVRLMGELLASIGLEIAHPAGPRAQDRAGSDQTDRTDHGPGDQVDGPAEGDDRPSPTP